MKSSGFEPAGAGAEDIGEVFPPGGQCSGVAGIAADIAGVVLQSGAAGTGAALASGGIAHVSALAAFLPRAGGS